jgi:hypothetical protein
MMSLSDGLLKTNIKNTLLSQPMVWINFSVAGVTIGTMFYQILWGFINAGIVQCQVDKTKVRAGAAANFDPSSNTITTKTPEIRYTDEKANLVHECTHAVLDVILKSPMTDLTNETFAYLAEAIFTMASSVGLGYSPFSSGSIQATAGAVVTNKNTTIGGNNPPNGNVDNPIPFTPSDVMPLQTAIKASPLYKGIK